MIKSVYEDRVLIKIVDSPLEEGNYLLPQNHEDDDEIQTAGLVVQVGEKASDTQVGDVVVFGQYDFSKVYIEGVQYILTKEDNLICKLGPNEQEDSKGE